MIEQWRLVAKSQSFRRPGAGVMFRDFSLAELPLVRAIAENRVEICGWSLGSAQQGAAHQVIQRGGMRHSDHRRHFVVSNGI